MKISKSKLAVCLLTFFSCVAQDTIIVKPLLAFKFAPLGVLAPDPNFQFQAEFFTGEKSSVEVGFGTGSNRTFKESSKAATGIYRIEYKWYLRPFTTESRAVGYFATELAHKDILINERAFMRDFNEITNGSEFIDYQLDANFTTLRVKYGSTFFGEQGIPIFNAFFGIGAGYQNHRNIDLPEGYEKGVFGMDLFGRNAGSGMAISIHGGISFGFGITKKR